MMIKMMREMRDLEFPSAIKISMTSLVLQHKIQKDTLT